MKEYKLTGFQFQYKYMKVNEILSYAAIQLEQTLDNRKLLLCRCNNKCISVDITEKESEFVKCIIGSGVLNWNREYESNMDWMTKYHTKWKLIFSFDGNTFISKGDDTFPDDFDVFCKILRDFGLFLPFHNSEKKI
ncbi:hypothetical protein [Floccifex sp.]|uniref:hypothetical protein n=1 Tax=Floccifex sp. TaxID=2815810 RepID=UPI003F057B87